MIIYLIMTTRGVLALNTELEPQIIQKFDPDPLKVAEKFIQVKTGGNIPELDTVLAKLEPQVSSVFCMDHPLVELAKNQLTIPVSPITDTRLLKEIRQHLPTILIEVGLEESHQTFFSNLREVGMALTKTELRKSGEERDRLVIQAVHAIDDITKTINLLASRIREWYGLHFPEADRLIEDHKYFLELVSNIGSRSLLLERLVREEGRVPKQLAEKLLKTAQDSVGAELAESDILIIQQLSNATLDLYRHKEELEQYITKMMNEVAPNLQGLVGSLLGARLIGYAGGLERMAKLPSSTIQVLGAEKALFRSLRTNALPPKHGIIFQFPEIHQNPRWLRGKIARALAGKITIAARVDAFKGQYIADKLRTNLLHSINEIKQRFPKPPKRKTRRITPKKKRKQRRSRKTKRR